MCTYLYTQIASQLRSYVHDHMSPYLYTHKFGRGDDTVGNSRRAQMSQVEVFELIPWLKLHTHRATYTQTELHIQTHRATHTNTYAYAYIYTHSCIYKSLHILHIHPRLHPHMCIYIYIYIHTYIYVSDPLWGSSVKVGTTQRRLAWPMRKDDTHKSRSVIPTHGSFLIRCQRGHAGVVLPLVIYNSTSH